MKANGREFSTVRDLIYGLEWSSVEVGREIGLDKSKMKRRLKGEARWTALEVIRFHYLLRRRRVRHSLIGLLKLFAGWTDG